MISATVIRSSGFWIMSCFSAPLMAWQVVSEVLYLFPILQPHSVKFC